jgi:hypothetical protein
VRDLTRSTARNGQNLVAGRGQSGLWFLAAARPQEEALESVFAEALESVASSLGAGSSQPYLSLDSVVSGINAIFERRMLQQRADLGAQDVMTLPPFIDNPDYDPDRAVGLDTDGRHRQAAAWREDRDAHWDPRSRGVPRATDPGRYFWAGSGH